ncbi:hypothetical protein, partial, partial [Absidia glauca]
MINLLQKQEEKKAKLQLKDIPKLCIKGHESEKGSPQPFASAKHFLRRFELVLSSANLPIDKHWEQWLECAIELEQLPWFQQSLAKKNLTWKEAQHRITMAYDQMEPKLFSGLGLLKLRMTQNETVQDFRLRFQKSLNDAGWTDNYQTAQVCINALPQRLKEFVVNKFFDTKNHEDENASYHKVPTKASQVLNIAMKYNGYSSNNNSNNNMAFSSHMKRPHEPTFAPTKRARQHCELHPHQSSHSTANCWSRPGNEHLRPSRWRGPKQATDTNIRVQAISRVPNDQDMEYTDLRQISEGKTKSASLRSPSNNRLLYTPITIHNKRMMGMLDTGADVSVISHRLVELNRIPFKVNKGTLLLAGANNKINRIGTTHPLLINYNYKTIYHTFEIMHLPDEIDVYLGMDLIPTSGIYIGGLAVQWSDQVTSLKDEIVNDHPPEPNDSPAGT